MSGNSLRKAGPAGRGDPKIDYRGRQDQIEITVEYKRGSVNRVGRGNRNARGMEKEAQMRGLRGVDLKRGESTRGVAENRLIAPRGAHLARLYFQIAAELDRPLYDMLRPDKIKSRFPRALHRNREGLTGFHGGGRVQIGCTGEDGQETETKSGHCEESRASVERAAASARHDKEHRCHAHHASYSSANSD